MKFLMNTDSTYKKVLLVVVQIAQQEYNTSVCSYKPPSVLTARKRLEQLIKT